jgi:tetratricopeptide (TPR) repeat protein
MMINVTMIRNILIQNKDECCTNLISKTMKKSMYQMMTVMLILGFILSNSCTVIGNQPEKDVRKAFEMRMNGKVDEAKAHLDSILEKDPTNAMAWYELARLKHYMLVGGGDVKTNEILATINKAVVLEPKNVTYAYYKGIACFMNAFMAMQMGQGEVKDKIAETTAQFEKVLALKPAYHEARLYLVDIYGLLPPDMGGDSLKAALHAEKLSSMDTYFGSKAKAALAPEGTDLVKFWEDLIAFDSQNANLFMEQEEPAFIKRIQKMLKQILIKPSG